MQYPIQVPVPGSHLLTHAGDVVEFTLTTTRAQRGSAWLRTTLGNAHLCRLESIRHTEAGTPRLASAWHDLPMRRVDGRRHALTLPLLDPGIYEAKAYLLPENGGDPTWSEGTNVSIKIEPAEWCAANTVYTAFVRQFGPNRRPSAIGAGLEDKIGELEDRGHAVIPPSGTFRDLIAELDFIIGTLGFRIIQLLPVHPVPTTFARMGRFGSPFAALDFLAVDPALATFDHADTPLDQFRELVDAVHARGARIFLDIPVNHTGWGSVLQERHAEWFVRNPDHTFRSPGAWGITWEDLVQLDYGHRELWTYMAGVFRFWCRQGVDGFRCDAGYMVPETAWEYIVAKVRSEFPSTVFLLEGLGGKKSVMERLLGRANLNWAYSELFQNYDRPQIETYLSESIRISSSKGLLVHFAETHDNDRLASVSVRYARMRTALAALSAHGGAFGITNGVEWFARTKLDVHGAGDLNWGNPENQVEDIARLNAILATHPAFAANARMHVLPGNRDSSIAVLRESATGGRQVLVLVNLDIDKRAAVAWQAQAFHPVGPLFDMLTGTVKELDTRDGLVGTELEPGQVLSLCSEPVHLPSAGKAGKQADILCPAPVAQRLRHKALQAWSHCHGYTDLSEMDADAAAKKLARHPAAFCATVAGRPHAAVTWHWPRDERRKVMVPPEGFLLVTCEHRFEATMLDHDTVVEHEHSLPCTDRTHFALFMPRPVPTDHHTYTLELRVHGDGNCARTPVPILYLADWAAACVHRVVERVGLEPVHTHAVCTNGCGAMAQVRAAWGRVSSRYDAFLAANLHPEFPVDRHVLLTRCRAWVVFQGYYQELNGECLRSFSASPPRQASWSFDIPVGCGKTIALDIGLRLPAARNLAELSFRRGPSKDSAMALDAAAAVKLIVRPDVENRTNHGVTKAYLGPEASWRQAVLPSTRGFRFHPPGQQRLDMRAAKGTFTLEPEWRYMVPHPFEATRGMDDSCDLFSPGYFTFLLREGDTATLRADADVDASAAPRAVTRSMIPPEPSADQPVLDAMREAMSQFIVRRGDGRTVIAGYPWFLDWGRDTVICLRGMIAAGWLDESREILRQFARFEQHGTLPNMIRGNDASNRDTSDAPLWFFVACRDLIAAGDQSLPELDCGGRSIRDVLLSIAHGYLQGTPNGIAVDAQSGLVFSPAHFTWMDTNYPAGTPREGYPIEIQALWYAALRLLEELAPGEGWNELAGRVRGSILRHYRLPGQRWLSDCLHAGPGTAPSAANADDALRPNQLLAITLGAMTDRGITGPILDACAELLVPGAIRSLADRPVAVPLAVMHKRRTLNDPLRPYQGRYQGDEDTQRKPAYHNGTAWTWIFPSYPEALFITHGEPLRKTAAALLASCTELINAGCVGQVPEIVDGDWPHTLRGCGAQAWGATELYRVGTLLNAPTEGTSQRRSAC